MLWVSTDIARAAFLSLLVAGTAARDEASETNQKASCRTTHVLPLELQLELNNGVKVPRIGFGTAGLGLATESSLQLAIEAGYRHIDTAQAQEWYQEGAVGRAVKHATRVSRSTESETLTSSCIAVEPEDGSGSGCIDDVVHGPGVNGEHASASGALSRGDVFVTTKVHPRDFSSDRLRVMLEASRTKLDEAWESLEKIYSEGAVRAIGVSNFPEQLLRELLGIARVVPAVVQNWMDPFHQDRAVRSLCAEKGIVYVAYSTLGGQWTYRSSPPSKNPVSMDATLRGIAEVHRTSPQAVTLSWALQSGVVVLPRSSNAQRIEENLRSFLVPPSGDCRAASIGEMTERGEDMMGGELVAVFLTQDEMDAIGALDGTLGN